VTTISARNDSPPFVDEERGDDVAGEGEGDPDGEEEERR